MKLFISFTIFLFSFSTAIAQDWNTNIDKSLKLASKENKNIILVFSGSDWCAPCKKIDSDILQSEEFISYASENWILLKADFPKKKKNRLSKEQQDHNDMLADKYKGTFPLIVVLDSNGKTLKRIGYERHTPKEYIDFLK